ncbi:MAG: DUF1631 family protein [Pseudomonadota bacterium]
MDNRNDPRNVFSAMHHRVTGELLHLMDGFYSNIEDGLFELAFRNDDAEQRTRCFDLMREMRYRRGGLIQTFAKRMQRAGDAWLGDDRNPPEVPELMEIARGMSDKCSSHFGTLLQQITERTSYGTDRALGSTDLPISPYYIAYHFIASCQSLEFDRQAIAIVQDLFARFVLDRLGAVYGECNQRLEAAGFYTQAELDLVSSSSAS